jgi:HK97 family phage major capsid protein
MEMRKQLEKMLKAKEEARQALVNQSEKSENVEELRSLQKQIETSNAEIAELRTMIANCDQPAPTAEPPAGEPQNTSDDNDTNQRSKTAQQVMNQSNNQPQNRSYAPGKGFHALAEGAQQIEDRQQVQQAKEDRGKALKEGRSVTVANSSIVLPQTFATAINGTFLQVSSLIDGVDQLPINGGESYSESYEITTPDGAYTLEGADPADTDVTFGHADILKAKVTSYSEITEEITKLAAVPYEDSVMKGITRSVRKKLAKEIMIGDGAANHLAGIFSTAATAIDATTDLTISAIDNTTLDNIIYSYGGSEAVEGQAALILNKKDLKAFAALRSTDGKKFHTIVLGPTGGYGTIDGIPFLINSACGVASASATASGTYCMAFGDLKNYRMTIFSDLEVQRSTDYKFKEGMIAHRGVAFIGGNVVAYNGFLRVKKS